MKLFRKIPHLKIAGAWTLLLLAASCTWFDRPEPLPVYLNFKGARVALNADGTQTSPLGIKDFWVDHNGVGQGVYRLPAVIPLIPDANNRITLAGGIYETGLSSVRSRYPFWEPVTYELGPDVQPLDTFTFQPTFRYYADTVLAYPLKETFEEASMSFVAGTGNNSADLVFSGINPLQGGFCGAVQFTSDNYEFEALTTGYLSLPQRGNNDVYLEISYRNDIPFTVGLIAFNPFTSQIEDLPAGLYFNSDLVWNTVFIHINDAVRQQAEGTLFRPYIRATSKDASSGAVRSGQLFLDNLRIVHFK